MIINFIFFVEDSYQYQAGVPASTIHKIVVGQIINYVWLLWWSIAVTYILCFFAKRSDAVAPRDFYCENAILRHSEPHWLNTGTKMSILNTITALFCSVLVRRCCWALVLRIYECRIQNLWSCDLRPFHLRVTVWSLSLEEGVQY